MKPAWDKLGAEHESSNTVVIGDVDCTIEKDLCSRFGVRGYPTIKYFTDSTDPTGDKYEGGRDLATLQKFVSESLGPSCGLDNKAACNTEQLAALDEADKISTADLKEAVSTQQTAIDDAEENFKESVEGLNAQYQALVKAKEDTIAANTPNLKLYRGIIKSRETAGHDEL